MNEHRVICDILVAGGGPAGVTCALAAARAGARVVLCQDRSVLGGNASSEVRMHIAGATGLSPGIPLEIEAREGGLIEEIRLDLAVLNPQRSPSMLDLVLYDKCRRQSNLSLFLNTAVVQAEVADGEIRRVVAERQSTEDRFLIQAKIFVDCTGDGRLGSEAGAPFMEGRESHTAYAERLAPPAPDRKRLGSTLLFQARRHHQPMPFTAPPWVRKFVQEDFKFRPFGQPGSDLGLEFGYWWVEWGGCLDTIKDNELIRDELLAIMLGVWNYIKNHSGSDASQWALEWFGFLPGKRESRRFLGQYVLRESDLIDSREFSDAIAYGGWPIDTHPPEGVDAPSLPPCEQHHLPYFFNIPLRACISAGLSNLMFAGRNISATHIAFASTRVMATCAVVGQAVGTAAALAQRAGLPPSEIPARPELIRALQQQLLKDDCYIVGIRNEDPLDLALQATITASSEQPNGEGSLVASGQTRSVHGPSSGSDGKAKNENQPELARNLWSEVLEKMQTGEQPRALTTAPPGRAFPGVHRWMSDPRCGLPAWIALRWPSLRCVREVILIFDTGLHRHLTLTQADGYARTMMWGRPQPETVRDYSVEFETDCGWQPVSRVTDNYQRRRAHVFLEAPTVRALRIMVHATNGLDHARICEIRAYS